ncbi:MAG TPA: glycosyltransferase family 1 protein [Flavitalea sp.]|nr:glycosyltransferase family 1 protein [Flavitalea sp.]
MKIVLIFRSNKLGYHSIENVFGTIHRELSACEQVESYYVQNSGFSLFNILNLLKLVKQYASDTIFHVTGDIHYAVFALPRKRSILTIHDCVFINKRKGLRGWILKKLYLDWPVRYVTAVTAISDKTKNEIIRLTGCSPHKINVINNPVSSFIRFTEKSFNTCNPVLLFIGSLPNKNLNRVIEALKGLPCTLNIIGQVNEQQQAKMKEFHISYKLEKNLSNEQMAARYEQADIILFPSLYEGFGLPVIEGFKAGRAVLTSDIAPLKELADGAAWLVNPYSIDSIRNTLDRIINDKEARNKKIRNGLENVQQYSPGKVTSKYYQAYLDLNLNKLAVLTTLVPYIL